MAVCGEAMGREVTRRMGALLELCLDKLNPTKGLVSVKLDTSYNPVLRWQSRHTAYDPDTLLTIPTSESSTRAAVPFRCDAMRSFLAIIDAWVRSSLPGMTRVARQW